MSKIAPIMLILAMVLNASPAQAVAVLKFAKKAVSAVKTVAATAGSSEEGSGSPLVGQIIAKVASSRKDSKAAQAVCKKGSGLKAVSIRSGDGAVCSAKAIWALAELLCAKVEDYAQSKCHGKHQDANPTEILRGMIKSKSTPGLEKICEEPTPELAPACS